MDSIPAEKLAELANECEKWELPQAGLEALTALAGQLAVFEREIKPTLTSGAQRRTALVDVAEKARALQQALLSVPSDDLMIIDTELDESVSQTDDTNPFDLLHVQSVSHAIGRLQNASLRSAQRLEEWGVVKGRVRTLGRYAGFVLLAAIKLKPFGIVPGDGGPFRRLCDAVFSAAGVPANSQGAIKLFLKTHRPVFRNAGACL